jgi:CRP-like cAMP-binding protein
MPAATRLSTPNHLLAAFSRQAHQHLLTGLDPVELICGQVLYRSGEQIRYVYFPIDCIVSLLTAVDKRRTLEVGMVGNEGMVGIPLALGVGVSAVRALVLVSGTAMRMTAVRFRAEFKNNISLQQLLFRYTHSLIAQLSQTAACNQFHNATARMARWLLTTSDCLHIDDFRLTQALLAQLLGLRRVSVTRAASDLKQKKLIDYSRGNIRIVDRKRLEVAACTCYRIVKDLEDNFMGLPHERLKRVRA